MLTQQQFAMNHLQWITVGLSDASGEPGETGWEYERPSFIKRQPQVLLEVRESGFGAVMLEVLPTQTLQSYARVIEESGLRVAPGYAQIGLPEDFGEDLTGNPIAHHSWFDGIRRRAEESLYMGLDRVFLAPDMAPGRARIDVATAVGYKADTSRLERVANIIGEAATVLKAEGVTGALHNHVGSWIETKEEFDYVLDAVPADILSAGPDIGHLAWTGADVVSWMGANSDRISDVHIKDMDLTLAARSRETPTPYFEMMDQRFFLELGLGDVPIQNCLAQLPADFAGSVIVEVDKPSMNPFESAKVSWSWVAENYPMQS